VCQQIFLQEACSQARFQQRSLQATSGQSCMLPGRPAPPRLRLPGDRARRLTNAWHWCGRMSSGQPCDVTLTIETGDSFTVLRHEHMPTQVVPGTNQLTQYSPYSLIRAPSTAVRHRSILPTTSKPPHHQCHLPTAWCTNCVTHSSVDIGTATFTPQLQLTLPRSSLHACQLPTLQGALVKEQLVRCIDR
jgi:hypothetical protein